MPKPKIACVVGTRPDAIKSAPVVLALQHVPEIETLLVSTGQHREMLDQVFATFGLQSTVDLNLMQHGQSLASLSARALEGLAIAFEDLKPDYVIAQGDTTTTFIASLAAFYRQIPFGHVEAGLRTETVHNPFPEEFNRRATGLIAEHHFAPTTMARDNLLAEHKDPSKVFVTGNTGIDAVLAIAERSGKKWYPEHDGRVILLTTHRRENWGEPQQDIAQAALEVLRQTPDALLVVPMHRNPLVRETLTSVLGGQDRVELIEPPEYEAFVTLMQRATLILTDSGGVQEEAPSFGVPVLVLRENTERPEGVDAGNAKLVGTDREKIVFESLHLLRDSSAYDRMSKTASPYGDGRAAARIRHVVCAHLDISTPKESMWT